VDFVSYERRVVVELDGAQHLDSREDRARDSWLRQEGFKVLRFWNKDVLQNVEGVAARILEEVAPPPQPSPAQGGGG
jgi:very-short-patch-repair endonuclease